MSDILLGNLAKATRPGLNSIIGMRYEAFEEEWKYIFEEVEASKMSFEQDLLVSGLGLPQVKNQDGPIAYSSMQQFQWVNYVHVVYAIMYRISREMVEDNLYPKLAADMIDQIPWVMNQAKEIVCANVLNRSTNSSFVGPDSLSLLNTGHLLGRGGTLSNTLATPGPLSEATLEQLLIQVGEFVDNNNQPIKILPKYLIIPVQTQFEAERITKSQLRYDTAENAINAVRNMGMLPEGYKVNHYLTQTGTGQYAWYLKTNCLKGLRLFQRDPLELANDTPEFSTESMAFKGRERYAVGWTDFRGIAGSYL